MPLKKAFHTREELKASGGITLVEVLLSVVLLGIISLGIAHPYITGLKSLEIKSDRMLLDSRLRSQMEVLISTDFSTLSNGSEVVTINGKNYTITWTVVNVDMDGDATAELDAKQVTVSVTEVPGHSLTTILVDTGGIVGKVS